MREVIADIENRNNRTLAAIEAWVAAKPGRELIVSFEAAGTKLGRAKLLAAIAAADAEFSVTALDALEHVDKPGWSVAVVSPFGQIERCWIKPTIVDALAHAAAYCQLEAA